MELGNALTNINYLAVFIAALSSFIVGWLWYGPLFGRKWMDYQGFAEDDIKEGSLPFPAILIINYLATVLAAFALAMFLGPEAGTGFGIFAGLMVAVFWIATSRLNDVLYERKPWGLFFINAGYYMVIYPIMGAVIGAWQ